MSKLVLASLCAGLLSCAAQQAEYYIDQLDDSRSQVRLDASHALVQLGGAAVEPVMDRAAAGSDSLRYIAAQLLGHHRTHRALDALCLALTDDNIWVRAESARTLGRIGDTTAVAPLERMFAEREGPDHEAAKEALQQLTGLNYAVAP